MKKILMKLRDQLRDHLLLMIVLMFGLFFTQTLKISWAQNRRLNQIALLPIANESSFKSKDTDLLFKELKAMIEVQSKGKFEIKVHDQIYSLLETLSLDLNYCDLVCASKIANQMNTGLVVFTKLTEYGKSKNSLRLWLSLVNVKDASIIHQVKIKGSDLDEIKNQLNTSISELLLEKNQVKTKQTKDLKDLKDLNDLKDLKNLKNLKASENNQGDSWLKLNPYGIDWIFIKGGSFMMGINSDESDEPRGNIKIKDFYMSKTEVTIRQYRKCVEAGVCTKPNGMGKRYCNWGYQDRDNYPVNCINWYQARTFAKWVGGDLPSEAQWEYAARSQGQNIQYPWGNQESSCEYAVMRNIYPGCDEYRSWAVCSKQKGNTQQGLCDMLGNVEEWVLDEFHKTLKNESPPSDDSGWCSDPECIGDDKTIRFFCGGGWKYSINLNISHCRDDSLFSGCVPKSLDIEVGFRVAHPKVE